MENLALKMKISVLWLFKALAALAFSIMMLMEEGVLEGIMAGEILGMQIGPEACMRANKTRISYGISFRTNVL